MGFAYNCFWCNQEAALAERYKRFPRFAKAITPIEDWPWQYWVVSKLEPHLMRATLQNTPYRPYRKDGPYGNRRFTLGNYKRIRMCPEHYTKFTEYTAPKMLDWAWEMLDDEHGVGH